MKKTISFSHLPILISVTEAKNKPLHYHPDVLEIMFILDGMPALTTDQKSVFYHPGEFAILNPGQLHSVYSRKPSTLVSIFYDLNHYVTMFPFIRSTRFCTTPSLMRPEQFTFFHELRNYFIRLMLMYNKNTPSAQVVMQDIAVKMMGIVWLHFQDRKEVPEQNLPRYYSISEYLYNHYRESISVSEVAYNENISVTRLAHFWKDITGFSILHSVMLLRLAEAEKMLLNSPLTINEIAYQCGFSNEKYFYQHFKAQYKTTPNEYRIKCLEDRNHISRVLLSKREGARRLDEYAMRFYDADAKTTLPDLTPEEQEKERNLEYLYEAILTNHHNVAEQFAITGQDVGYILISPSKALLLRDGEYHINWEYVYAQMHIFLDFNCSIQIFIDFDCMDVEHWEPLLSLLIDEIRNIWGKSVIESQSYSILSKSMSSYRECIELAEYLKETTPVQRAQAIYRL